MLSQNSSIFVSYYHHSGVLRHNRSNRAMQDEISYICDRCGEEIVIPFDFSQGKQQDFVEDCPVCCHPNQISIQVSPEGDFSIESELE